MNYSGIYSPILGSVNQVETKAKDKTKTFKFNYYLSQIIRDAVEEVKKSFSRVDIILERGRGNENPIEEKYYDFVKELEAMLPAMYEEYVVWGIVFIHRVKEKSLIGNPIDKTSFEILSQNECNVLPDIHPDNLKFSAYYVSYAGNVLQKVDVDDMIVIQDWDPRFSEQMNGLYHSSIINVIYEEINMDDPPRDNFNIYRESIINVISAAIGINKELFKFSNPEYPLDEKREFHLREQLMSDTVLPLVYKFLSPFRDEFKDLRFFITSKK